MLLAPLSHVLSDKRSNLQQTVQESHAKRSGQTVSGLSWALKHLNLGRPCYLALQFPAICV